MIRSATLVLLMLCWLAPWGGPTAAAHPPDNVIALFNEGKHPDKATIGRATFREAKKRLEVELRLDPIVLGEALDKHFKKKIDLDKTPDAKLGKLIQAYVEAKLAFLPEEGAQAKLKWVGQRLTMEDAYLYFEVPLTTLQGLAIEHTMLFEFAAPETNVVNLLNIEWGKKRVFPRFTPKATAVTLDFDGPAARAIDSNTE